MPLSPLACAADSSPQRALVAFAQTRSTDVDEAYEQEVEQAEQALQRGDSRPPSGIWSGPMCWPNG